MAYVAQKRWRANGSAQINTSFVGSNVWLSTMGKRWMSSALTSVFYSLLHPQIRTSAHPLFTVILYMLIIVLSLHKMGARVLYRLFFIDICCSQVVKDIEELNRLCQLATRPHVRQLLQRESEKLSQSCTVTREPAASAAEQMETSCTTAEHAVPAENITQHSDAAAVTNPCIAVTRSVPQHYYKGISTYGEMVCEVFWNIFTFSLTGSTLKMLSVIVASADLLLYTQRVRSRGG